MSDEQKPGDPADKATDGAFLAWVTSHPTARLGESVGGLLLAENNRLSAENAALTAAVERVRALHRDVEAGVRDPEPWYWCSHCRVPQPCSTLRALEETP